MPAAKAAARPRKPGRKPARKPAPKRAAGPAPRRAQLLAPFSFSQSPTIAVPALGPGVNASASFAALKLPAKAASGKVSSTGVVFLRGTLFADPARPAGAPCTLFTLPAGMRPSCEGFLHATYRDQGLGPVVPIVLRFDTSGRVDLDGPPLMYDSMIWLDGISFLL